MKKILLSIVADWLVSAVVCLLVAIPFHYYLDLIVWRLYYDYEGALYSLKDLSYWDVFGFLWLPVALRNLMFPSYRITPKDINL